ncbi:N-acyl homoserine lactonase family protein [Streptomyces noursei]|uniref:N-acyl homoserine lactonase family protein n=1 Tax=Streptomyces noursei TaxID=1971 RepID=UPI0035D886A3
MQTTSTHTAVHRLDLGYFVRPASETGGPEPRVEPVLAYLVEHDRGLLLFDTGVGAADPETEAHYRPRRRPLQAALAAVGASLADVSVVVNCHLHFDHCGGNPLLAGKPIVVQAVELATARRGGHTFDELIDFPGARYEELTGEAEIWPGVRVVPTPGHTDGHQSLVLQRPDGTVVLAGQARDVASHYAADHLARQAASDGVEPPLPGYPRWLDRLADFAPRRVLFAHDCSVWEPPRAG